MSLFKNMNILECSSKNDDETSHKLDKLIRQNAKVIFLRVDQVTGFFFFKFESSWRVMKLSRNKTYKLYYVRHGSIHWPFHNRRVRN